MAAYYVGISGWTYAPWRGSFYPRGLPQRLELEHAAARTTSIEVNGSFYSLQRPESYRSWAERTPDGFVLSVKGGRFITHLRKLAGVETALANFFASGVLALGAKLGPVLWQLPPQLHYDPDRLEGFLRQLPRTAGEAAQLAGRHDGRLEGRAWTTTDDPDRPVRHALEVRHASYEVPALVEQLRAHRVALVVADTAGKWPLVEDQTAGFTYVRLHGSEELYVSGYDPPALDAWAARARTWAAGEDPPGARLLTPPRPAAPRDVHVYFDNDVKVRAPFDAMGLLERLRGPAGAR
ncbi:DUF72 domain-containing protein [Vallicoccus soli]|uniref:DUF72 domain-containing protein n=1 Tax=Vallicoccus soli TaxID=2339232 RepID=A0A3A3ZKI1_9ACTN|nr:DUF72 domain-containing protein [Vallicoccus soli]RJK96424.1 DUF72 domain-containing protein [Vallicoccus soli]